MSKKQQFATAGARNGAQGAMAFRRSPAGNHVEPRRRDKWERQADEAAHRILRGERSAARMLTPAAAASLTVPLSQGVPLPSMLRIEMEESFGADLSDIRIHRDQHAAAAARLQHAAAFTSGSNLFFGDGLWSPWSGRGRELIAHEIAHALQQTGRQDSRGCLRATNVVGAGQVQCKEEEFVALAEKYDLFELHAAELPSIAPGRRTDNSQPVVARREGTIFRSPEEKPSDKSSVVPKQAADAGKTSVPQAKKENEFLPAVDEGGSKKSAAAEAPVGKEIPGARATPEKEPASPEEDAKYQAVVEELEIKTKGERTPPKKPVEKQKETILAANSASGEIIEKQNDYRNYFAHLDQLEQVQPADDLTVEKFMDEFGKNISVLAKKLPEKKENYGSAQTTVELAAGKVKATQEVAQQVKTHSEPLQKEAGRDPFGDNKEQEPSPYELKVDPSGATPTIKNAKAAAPKPKTDDAISLDDQSRALDDVLSNHNVGGQAINIDEGSLAFPISGEKVFEEAGEAKRKAQDEIVKAKPKYREEERQIISASEDDIHSLVNVRGLQGHHGLRSENFKAVLGTQEQYKSNIKKDKASVLPEFHEIYQRTKDSVDRELLLQKPTIEETFDNILSEAEKQFEERVRDWLDYIYTPGHWGLDYSDWKGEHEDEINQELKKQEPSEDRWPREIASGYLKALKKVQDRSADKVFADEKKLFIDSVFQQVERQIANRVVAALSAAKKRVAEGEQDLAAAYGGLDAKEKLDAANVYEAVKGQFGQLRESVQDRQRDILNDMARTYNQSVGKLQGKFDEIKKDVLTSWLDKAWNKLKAVVNAIIDFATRIAELLGRLIYLLGDIISSPRHFFNNLVTGIGRGFSTFVDGIGEFLATAFFDWLRGSSGLSIQMPKDWGPAGIFSLFTQLLSLGAETVWQRMEVVYDKTTANAFRRGEVVMDKGLEIFGIIKDEGLGGLWDHIKESLGNILEETLGMIKENVLYAAIKRVILEIGKMLFPGGGFIAIAEKVIRLLQFIADARDKILDLIESFVDSVEMAVNDDVSGIAKHITGALTKFITVALDFLVVVFGLGSLKEKVERFIERMRKPIIAGIDWLLNKFKPIVMNGKRFLKKGKEEVIGVGKRVAGAATGWVRRLLGVERRFRGEDGSNHRLYFAQQASTAVLMINPDPAEGFENWVAHIKPDTRSEAGKRRAQKKAQEIDRVQAQPITGNTDAEKQASEEQKVKTVRLLIDELSAITGPLFKGERPDCAIQGAGLELGGLRKSKYGTSMEATFLTNIKMPAGSVPAPPHLQSFEVINQRRNQGGAYYVKGHLLNNNLGGTGKVWKNLTPLTREANSKHEHIAEARVKNAVAAGNIVYYAVHAEYGRSAPIGPNRTIQSIMNEEVDVPKKLVCEAELVTPANISSSGREKRTPLVPPGTEIENNISQRPADYDLTGIRRETVYLNSGKVDAIASIEGVDRRLAQKIVDAHDDKGSQFVSIKALAEYKFSTGEIFTELQKNTILSFSDLGYVLLYERITE